MSDGSPRGRMPSGEGKRPVADAAPTPATRATPGGPARTGVRVTSPRTSAARTRTLSIASEIDEQTRLG